MDSTIVNLDHKEYGLEENRANEIASQFQPMLDKMKELEVKYNEILKLPQDDPKTSKKAKELRLKYVKVRKGTEEIHKKQKAFYLAGGRYVDGWKNTQKFASQGIEDKLKEIETYQERIEAEEREKLRQDRWEKLKPYMESEPEGLSKMENSVFENLLSGAKSSYEQKLEAERKAEEERIELDRKEQLLQDRQNLARKFGNFFDWDSLDKDTTESYFVSLMETAEKRKVADDEERERVRIENERLRKEAEKERREREERERKEREAHEKAIKKEREERKRVEAEIEEKRKEEEKERKRQDEYKRKIDRGSDKDKLRLIVKQIEAIECSGIKNEYAKEIEKEVESRLLDICNYIEIETEKL